MLHISESERIKHVLIKGIWTHSMSSNVHYLSLYIILLHLLLIATLGLDKCYFWFPLGGYWLWARELPWSPLCTQAPRHKPRQVCPIFLCLTARSEWHSNNWKSLLQISIVTTRVGEGVGRMKVKGRRFGGINKARSSGRAEGKWRDRRAGGWRAGEGLMGCRASVLVVTSS